MKKFADIKTICNFAGEIVTKQFSKEVVSGVFYAHTAKDISRSIPCACCYLVTVAWSQIQEANGFFYFIINNFSCT